MICNRIDQNYDNQFICKKCINLYQTNKLKHGYCKKTKISFEYIIEYLEIDRKFIDFKFNNLDYIKYGFVSLINSNVEILNILKNSIIIPIPISKIHFKTRGYNQVIEILDLLNLDIKYYDILVKKDDTLISSLNQKQRFEKKGYIGIDQNDKYKIKIIEEFNNKIINEYTKKKDEISNDISSKINIVIFDDIITTTMTAKNARDEIVNYLKNVLFLDINRFDIKILAISYQG